MSTTTLLQPSSSSLATAIAAAFNLVEPPEQVVLDAKPDGRGAEDAKKWAALIGDRAAILVAKVKTADAGD